MLDINRQQYVHTGANHRVRYRAQEPDHNELPAVLGFRHFAQSTQK